MARCVFRSRTTPLDAIGVLQSRLGSWPWRCLPPRLLRSSRQFGHLAFATCTGVCSPARDWRCTQAVHILLSILCREVDAVGSWLHFQSADVCISLAAA